MTFLNRKGKYRFILMLLTIILFIVVIFACTIGTADISFKDSMMIIGNKIPYIGEYIDISKIDETSTTIILGIRLPRILVAGFVGVNLSVVGAAYQGMFKNPMADPYVLGVSAGSAAGATIAIVLGAQFIFLGFGIVTLAAFLGAILTTLLVYNIARCGSKIPTTTLLLSGISVSSLLSSVISVLMIFNRNEIEKIVMWIMGSVSAASFLDVYLVAPFAIIGTTCISFFARDLNAMMLGDETAKSLGIRTDYVKKVLLVITSLIVAASVSVSGIIGFVGLIIPHTVRLLTGPDHRSLIPLSAICGGIFMVISDTIARSIVSPAEIPVGAITSLFGAPYFIYLLYKNKKKVF